MLASKKVILPLSVLFFLCVNHFDGFEQDCILYTLQAFNRLSPERFIDDAAFMFGNQDSLSIFSPLYIFFLKLFPVDKAALFFTLLIHTAFAASAAWMLCEWTRRFHIRFLALPIILIFFSLYSYGEERNVMWSNIKSIEAFPVARTLSMSFGFAGLAVLFKKNKWISLPFFLVGTAIHPLSAGWCLPLWAFFHWPKLMLPVGIISALFPLSILLGREPFAPYPPEWVGVAPDMEGFSFAALNMLGFVAFFVFVAIKKNLVPYCDPLLRSFALIAGIAFYWFVISVFTGHILLFQFQTFRIQWMCAPIAIFFQLIVSTRLYISKIRKKKKLNLLETVFVILSLSLWTDSPFVIAAFCAGMCMVKLKENRFFPIAKWTLVGLWVFSACFAIYWIVFLQSHLMPELYRSYCGFIQDAFAVGAALAIILLIYCPRFKNIVVVVTLTSIAFILWGNEIFPRQNFSIAFEVFVLVFSLLGFKGDLGFPVKKMAYAFLFVALGTCVLYNYDHRNAEQKEKEESMNQFVKAPPFPQIEKRGRILYSVGDYAGRLPRLAFLSGAYFDEHLIVGSIFFKQHKAEVYSRERKLFEGADSLRGTWDEIKWNIRLNEACVNMLDRDSVVNRANYLCSSGEITHLVTDWRLDGMADDSLTLVYKAEKIFLYSCPRIMER